MSPSVVLDTEVRRSDHGRALVGGSPLRVIRLSDKGAQRLDAALAGEDTNRTAGTRKLLTRLLDAGILHPVPGPAQIARSSVGVVIPHYDDTMRVQRLLASLPRGLGSITVVDDGSPTPLELPERAVDPSVNVLRHDVSFGPGVARNTGWQETTDEIICFVDSDVVPQGNWLDVALAHFNDPAVGAVAPRVISPNGPSKLERYEAARSPLDLGDRPANAKPRTRVAYVPAATLLVRRAALEDLGLAGTAGFDPQLRTGEDVDFIWRLAQQSWTIRYEPLAVVHHDPRQSWDKLWEQRSGYGRSAAGLAQRHPHAITPFEASPYSAAAWLLVALGGKKGALLGLATAAASTAALVPKLKGRVDQPAAEAVRLAGMGTLHVGKMAAEATRRAWLPMALAGCVVSKRMRRATAAAMLVPPVLEWAQEQQRPPLDPFRWTAARVLDDASYCRGVWQGMAAARSLAAIRPRFPGLEQLLPKG